MKLRIGGGVILRSYQKAILKMFDNGIRYIVLCWSRRCISPDTLVHTDKGLIEVQHLNLGDMVLSFNHDTNKKEYKRVTGVLPNGLDTEPKPMVQFYYANERFRTTIDHPFFDKRTGQYVEAIKLVWRDMEASQRVQLQLLCQQYGSFIDDDLQGWIQNGGYDTSIGCKRLFTHRYGQKNDKGTSSSGADMDIKSAEQAAGQPPKQQSLGQSSEQSGVGDEYGKYSLLYVTRKAIEKLWRKVWYSYFDRGASPFYILKTKEVLRYEGEKCDRASATHLWWRNLSLISRAIGRRVWRHVGNGAKDLSSRKKTYGVEVFAPELTYDIQVEDNANFFIGRAGVLVHNCGKSLFAWNLLIREATSKPGTYWYCFNNYSTAYNDIWLAMTSKGVKFLDMIPKDMVVRMNSSKLEIELSNGSIIKLIGINNVDKLVGAGLMGVVFDEYAVLNPSAIELVTAMLAETGGWRVMISTPRGKNHFYDEYQFAKAHPDFACADNRHCGMPEIAQYMAKGFLEQERLKIISKYGNDALYQQEYMTSWISPNAGSVFGALAKIMRDEGRFTMLNIDHDKPCYTAWDLGNADYTSIVLFQVDGDGFPSVFDHIENRNEDVTWYIGEWIERGWKVHTHFLPHDAAHHKGARNESYKAALEKEGVTNTVVLSKPNRIEDKLNFLRRIFKGLKIDETLTRIMTCLDKLEYEWNEKLHIWSSTPTHIGGYSDTVDSLCYMGQAISKYKITSKKPFSSAYVADSNKIDDSPQAKATRFQKLMEEELSIGGNKKTKNNNISLFISS